MKQFLTLFQAICDNLQNVGVYAIDHEPGCECTAGFLITDDHGRAYCPECGKINEG